MATSTFVTPTIPFLDFADHNPGKGLTSIEDNVVFLRDAYGATRIKRITGPTGIQFAVTGPVSEIARLVELYR